MHDILYNRPRPCLPSEPGDPDDVQKTAITTQFGLFEFPFMFFGLRTLRRISKDSWTKFCVASTSASPTSTTSWCTHVHRRSTWRTPDPIQAATGLRDPANASKCVFRATEFTFLGYRISARVHSRCRTKWLTSRLAHRCRQSANFGGSWGC